MKYLIAVVIVSLVITSCSLDDGNEFDFELVPIERVTLPDTLVMGDTYKFDIVFKRPTQCHFFSSFDYFEDENTREVAVISGFQTNRSDCDDVTDIEQTTTLNFIVVRDDFYIFKFYQGNDENGTPQFLTVEVPVSVN